MNASRRTGFISYLLPALLYCAIIFLVSSLSAPPAPSYPFAWGDKVNHAGAFAIMMALVFRGIRWLLPERSTRVQLILALACCMLYGATDEIHQAFVPNRQCDIFDWMADTVGALLAMGCIVPALRTRWGRIFFGPAPGTPPAGER